MLFLAVHYAVEHQINHIGIDFLEGYAMRQGKRAFSNIEGCFRSFIYIKPALTRFSLLLKYLYTVARVMPHLSDTSSTVVFFIP